MKGATNLLRRMRRFFCIGLASLILFSGCTGNGNEKKAVKGGYRETEVKMPAGYQQNTNPVFLKDGRVIMVATRMFEEVPNAGGAVPADAKTATEGEAVPADAKTATEGEAVPADAKTATEGEAVPADAKATEGEAVSTEAITVAPAVKPLEMYTPPEQKYDILTWKDLTKEPTVDPLKLPANTYYDPQNTLITDIDGNPILRVNSYDQGKGAQKYVLYWLPEIKGAGKDAAPAAPAKEQPLDLGELYPNAVVALPGSLFAASSWNSVKILGADGKKVKDLSISYTNQMFRVGNNLVVIDGEKSELVFFDSTTLKESKRMKIARSVINNTTSAVGFDDGIIYFYGQNGIYKVDTSVAADTAKDAKVKAEAEMVLDFLQYSLADPQFYANGFTVGSDKQIIIMASSNMMGGPVYSSSAVVSTEKGNSQPQMHIYLYNWDPELNLSNKTVLTVSSLFTDQILRVAAFKFQKQHPDVQIKITQYYDKMEDQMKWSDFIRTVNTDILSGKAADIMFLDNLPLDSYTRRGILVDLNSVITEMGGAEKLNMGIVNGMKSKDGKLYALPLTYTTFALIGRKNVIDQVTDLPSLLTLKLAPEQKALSPMQKDPLFQQLLMTNLPVFIDKQSGNYRFDTPEFIGFLELVNRIYNEAQVPPPELPENPTEEDYKKMDMGNFYQNAQKDRYTGKTAMSMTTLGNLDSLSYEFTYSGGKDASWTFMPKMKDIGGEIFIPQTTMGISAKSKNQKLAIEFIKMIFSGEIEGVENYMWGFSVVKAQQERTIKNLLERYKQQKEAGGMGRMSIDEKTTVEMTTLTEQQMRDMLNRMDKCTIPVQFDQTLSEFLSEEIKPFLNGRKTAKEAAEALQRRAAAYLAE
jgi:ABC-type glycerol-3-phosphate transport system substrate-binding protein